MAKTLILVLGTYSREALNKIFSRYTGSLLEVDLKKGWALNNGNTVCEFYLTKTFFDIEF